MATPNTHLYVHIIIGIGISNAFVSTIWYVRQHTWMFDFLQFINEKSINAWNEQKTLTDWLRKSYANRAFENAIEYAIVSHLMGSKVSVFSLNK